MPIYPVRGTTKYGEKVEGSIEAPNQANALREIKRKYGMLRKGFEIFTSEQLDSVENLYTLRVQSHPA